MIAAYLSRDIGDQTRELILTPGQQATLAPGMVPVSHSTYFRIAVLGKYFAAFLLAKSQDRGWPKDGGWYERSWRVAGEGVIKEVQCMRRRGVILWINSTSRFCYSNADCIARSAESVLTCQGACV
jgi:hypothetical protein